VQEPDTLILNLTFLGTVGVAFLMCLILFLLGVITLLLAGVGRLASILVMALFGRFPRNETLPLVRLNGPEGATGQLLQGPDPASDGAAASGSAATPGAAPASGAGRSVGRWRTALRPQRLKPAGLMSSLRTAVAHHPALAAARREPPALSQGWATAVAEADARAVARARAAAPEIKLSVRDLPDPRVTADKVVEVAPLVESALDRHDAAGGVPRSFRKPQPPHPLTLLDTGSLVSLSASSVLAGKAAGKARTTEGNRAKIPGPESPQRAAGRTGTP
jgi:hypothetical protein